MGDESISTMCLAVLTDDLQDT